MFRFYCSTAFAIFVFSTVGFASPRLACGLRFEYSDETGKIIGYGNSDPDAVKTSVVIDPNSIGKAKTWSLNAASPLGVFKVNWSYGHSCLVNPAPGCSDQYIIDRPNDFERVYEMTLVSKEDGTQVSIKDAVRDFGRQIGPVVDTPTLKLKLKKPIYKGKAPVVGSNEEYISSVMLQCYRGFW